MAQRPQYTVHLVSYDKQYTEPVTGDAVEWYDTGVWLSTGDGRHFFPYQQVRAVHEHGAETTEPETGETAAESESTSGSEPRAEEFEE
ncbi:hypothetical protein ACFQH6_14585 [Halobacteriaceae archaeon GCM10025711]